MAEGGEDLEAGPGVQGAVGAVPAVVDPPESAQPSAAIRGRGTVRGHGKPMPLRGPVLAHCGACLVTRGGVDIGATRIEVIRAVIPKTCPCDIQRYFSTVKIENFIGKKLYFQYFCSKHGFWVHLARRLL